MSRVGAVLKGLRSTRARFYLADFHFHSPASFDVQDRDLPGPLADALERLPRAKRDDAVGHQERVFAAYPPERFYDDLLLQRDTVLAEHGDPTSDRWALLAITDHRIMKYAAEVSSHAWQRVAENQLIVMPGIELDVEYPVPPHGVAASAHVLCVFAPAVSESDMRLAICKAGESSWEPGDVLQLSSLPEFIRGIRAHDKYPAICIAAHVASSKGVQKETKNAHLSRLEAEISRVQGEIDGGAENAVGELRSFLADLVAKRGDDVRLSIEVLRLIGGCGFDALQVSEQHDEIHYRRLHRYKEGLGRAVPIVCSDAHAPTGLFLAAGGVPHLKVSELSAQLSATDVHEAVRLALHLGETRFSYSAPSGARTWISGIVIRRDSDEASSFWPVAHLEGDDPTRRPSFRLPLSRNLTCLVGGRGSGKSAAIEALAFTSRPGDFNRVVAPRQAEPDYLSRARATLAGCTVTLVWTVIPDEATPSLPKNAILATRYFNEGGKHEPTEYRNADMKPLVPEQVPNLRVQLFRLGDIENHAGAESLRGLFDQICGPEVDSLSTEIESLRARLRMQRSELVQTAAGISVLVDDEQPIREYAKRRYLLNQVNTERVKAAYEKLDQCETVERIVSARTEVWTEITDALDVAARSTKVSSFLADLDKATLDEKGKRLGLCGGLTELFGDSEAHGGTATSTAAKLTTAFSSLDELLESVAGRLAEVRQGAVEAANAHREKLEKEGLPAGGKDREAKKRAFEEAEKALAEYQALMEEWNKKFAERTQTVAKLRQACESRSDLRVRTASDITRQLRRDLDERVLIVEADAQRADDKSEFQGWMHDQLAGSGVKYREKRVEALIADGLTPTELRDLLMCPWEGNSDLLAVERDSVSSGSITKVLADSLVSRHAACSRVLPDTQAYEEDAEFVAALPQEIREGLTSFSPLDEPTLGYRVDAVLALDELVADDVPVIRLNDRPEDDGSVSRPLENLSPGQRCSAVLPILLLMGKTPLIIDQPEDNLDNRLIRQVIVNILSSIKLRRQIIVATHNPNLPVLGDVEQAVILRGVKEQECELTATGTLDDRNVAKRLVEVMEGGREAFQYRHSIYRVHWADEVEEDEVES